VIGATTCGARCRTMSLLLAGAAGALFGIGLLVSGMTQPARVIGFLDPLGGWDPTLVFVMAGAVIVYTLASRAIDSRRTEPWFDACFHVPRRRDVDGKLLAGAALFGVGWGLGGWCPGPGLVSAAAGYGPALVFALAMLAGMYLQHRTRDA